MIPTVISQPISYRGFDEPDLTLGKVVTIAILTIGAVGTLIAYTALPGAEIMFAAFALGGIALAIALDREKIHESSHFYRRRFMPVLGPVIPRPSIFAHQFMRREESPIFAARPSSYRLEGQRVRVGGGHARFVR